ncbi:transposase [Streptomyces sp. NPDC050610]|uniref:transposase n=1 Tax=Streptomyces sp. NPDC050610 TaxID=3157097 RepID=UPI00342BE5E3
MELFYLPPRSPELNDIELVWRHAKHRDYPQRAQPSTEALGQAIDRAMLRQRDRIRGTALACAQTARQPRSPQLFSGVPILRPG